LQQEVENELSEEIQQIVDYSSHLFDTALDKVYHAYGVALSFNLNEELTAEDKDTIELEVGEPINREIEVVYSVFFLSDIYEKLGVKLDRIKAYRFFKDAKDCYYQNIVYMSKIWEDISKWTNVQKLEISQLLN